MPLFTSYVFICGTEGDRYDAMTTNRLCGTIQVADQSGLICELTAIERALGSKAVIDIYPRLFVGARCTVICGPMVGIEGVVIARNNAKARMFLEVKALGQGLVMEIDADVLEPVD